MNEKMRYYLETIANQKCWNDVDDMDVYSFSGGNFDDAYNGGYDSERILLARELLEEFEES